MGLLTWGLKISFILSHNAANTLKPINFNDKIKLILEKKLDNPTDPNVYKQSYFETL